MAERLHHRPSNIRLGQVFGGRVNPKAIGIDPDAMWQDADRAGQHVRFEDRPGCDDVITIPEIEPSHHCVRRRRRTRPDLRPHHGAHGEWGPKGHPQRNRADMLMERLEGHDRAERVGDDQGRTQAKRIRNKLADPQVNRAAATVCLTAGEIPRDLREIAD
jgi:hypothetical protein